MPDPVRRQVDPAAVGTGLDPFLDHLFPEDLYLGLISADGLWRVNVCVFRAFSVGVARSVPAEYLSFCHGGRLLTPCRSGCKARCNVYGSPPTQSPFTPILAMSFPGALRPDAPSRDLPTICEKLS